MKHRQVVAALALVLGVVAGPFSYAQETLSPPATTGAMEHRDVQRLELIVGKSRVLDLPVAIKRASLANPDVADTVVLSPTQIYLTGKGSGVTNLTLWNESGNMMGVYDVVITPDITRLKENLFFYHRLVVSIGDFSGNDAAPKHGKVDVFNVVPFFNHH